MTWQLVEVRVCWYLLGLSCDMVAVHTIEVSEVTRQGDSGGRFGGLWKPQISFPFAATVLGFLEFLDIHVVVVLSQT